MCTHPNRPDDDDDGVAMSDDDDGISRGIKHTFPHALRFLICQGTASAVCLELLLRAARPLSSDNKAQFPQKLLKLPSSPYCERAAAVMARAAGLQIIALCY